MSKSDTKDVSSPHGNKICIVWMPASLADFQGRLAVGVEGPLQESPYPKVLHSYNSVPAHLYLLAIHVDMQLQIE